MMRRNWPAADKEMQAFVAEMARRGDRCEWGAESEDLNFRGPRIFGADPPSLDLTNACMKPACYGPCCFPPDYATMHTCYCHEHNQIALGNDDEPHDHEYVCRKCGQPLKRRRSGSAG